MELPKTRKEAQGTDFEHLWRTPDGWPTNVRYLTLDDQQLGFDPSTNQVFWDGQPLVTEKRWGTTERRFALAGIAIGVIGVGATVAQAVAAFMALPVH